MAAETLIHDHAQREAFNRKTINRIRRIQGQLSALEAMIADDQGSCEERVLRARTIEKGMSSLINHLFECYIENSLAHDLGADPQGALSEMQKILKLINS